MNLHSKSHYSLLDRRRHPFFKFTPEAANHRLNGPGGCITEGANSISLNIVCNIHQNIDIFPLRFILFEPFQNFKHPACSFTARGALTARFMVIKFRNPPDDGNEIGVCIHHNDSRGYQRKIRRLSANQHPSEFLRVDRRAESWLRSHRE